MAGKQKRSGFELPEDDVDQPGGPVPGENPSQPLQFAGASESWSTAALNSPSSEYPISEGSDLAAGQADRPGADRPAADRPDKGSFQETLGALKNTGQRAKRQLSTAVSRGYAAGSEAIEDVEGEMSLRPWSTFLAGAIFGGIAGYLIATRR